MAGFLLFIFKTSFFRKLPKNNNGADLREWYGDDVFRDVGVLQSLIKEPLIIQIPSALITGN